MRVIICEVVWRLSWGQDYTHPGESFSSVSSAAQAVLNISARLRGESDCAWMLLDCKLLSQPTGVLTSNVCGKPNILGPRVVFDNCFVFGGWCSPAVALTCWTADNDCRVWGSYSRVMTPRRCLSYNVAYITFRLQDEWKLIFDARRLINTTHLLWWRTELGIDQFII